MSTPTHTHTITPEQLKQKLQAGEPAQVIDVRTPGEYAGEHITDSRLIPLEQLDDHALQDCVDAPVYLLCRTGRRASQAAEKLAGVDAAKVHVVEGGLEACKQAGLPIERGRGVISLERQVRIGAGALVLLGLLLAVIHPVFLAIAAFVGAGLIFAGVTDWCGMAMLLGRMPWNQRGGDAGQRKGGGATCSA